MSHRQPFDLYGTAKFGNGYFLEVTDSSLEPKYSAGDYLWIREDIEAESGNLVIEGKHARKYDGSGDYTGVCVGVFLSEDAIKPNVA